MIDQYCGLILERVSRFLYGSQIDALTFLNANNNRVTRDEIKHFYDTATSSFPDIYKNYSFDRWLAFLENNGIIGTADNIVGATSIGKALHRLHANEGIPSHESAGVKCEMRPATSTAATNRPNPLIFQNSMLCDFGSAPAGSRIRTEDEKGCRNCPSGRRHRPVRRGFGLRPLSRAASGPLPGSAFQPSAAEPAATAASGRASPRST